MVRAKKSYGQHFLTSKDIARRIADALTLTGENPQVLEVGPGQGFLTKYLLEKKMDLKVVEADHDMVDHLHKNYIQLHGKVIAEDFLKLDFNHAFPNGQFSIIGNFPYNISSQIVFKMLDHRERIPELIGMFQKEMAERIIASPGGKDYGVISVLAQAYYEGEYLFSVSNQHFNPPQSAVRCHPPDLQKRGIDCDPKLFKCIVKQAFSQCRKMLRNTLNHFFENDYLMNDDYFMKRPKPSVWR
ncbi:MAG: 16S rRNA (adenine(1518)-N(6)/adenine(1519)-N(6))-dimethyltransferase RsmA [Saprospiraceae bacterium]